MKRSWRVPAGVALLAVFCATAALAGPKLEVKPATVDFGTIRQGEEQRKVLTVRNAGDADLVISQVRPSCTECVVDRIEQKTLKPGESLELPVTYQAAAALGKQSANLTFHTNDAVDPLKRVYLAVNVLAKDAVPRLEAEPAALNAGVVESAAPPEWTVRLRNTGKAALHIQDCAASPALSLAGAPKELAPDAEAVLRVRLAQAEPGILRAHITLLTDDPQRRVMTIPVRGYVASAEEVRRLIGGVALRPVRNAEGVLTSIQLLNRSAGPVEAIVAGATGPARAVAPGETVAIETAGANGLTLTLPATLAEPTPRVEKQDTPERN